MESPLVPGLLQGAEQSRADWWGNVSGAGSLQTGKGALRPPHHVLEPHGSVCRQPFCHGDTLCLSPCGLHFSADQTRAPGWSGAPGPQGSSVPQGLTQRLPPWLPPVTRAAHHKSLPHSWEPSCPPAKRAGPRSWQPPPPNAVSLLSASVCPPFCCGQSKATLEGRAGAGPTGQMAKGGLRGREGR